MLIFKGLLFIHVTRGVQGVWANPLIPSEPLLHLSKSPLSAFALNCNGIAHHPIPQWFPWVLFCSQQTRSLNKIPKVSASFLRGTTLLHFMSYLVSVQVSAQNNIENNSCTIFCHDHYFHFFSYICCGFSKRVRESDHFDRQMRLRN